MPAHAAPPPYWHVAVRTVVLHIVMDCLYVVLQLVIQRKPSSTDSARERLDTIGRMKSSNVPAQIKRRSEFLTTNITGVVGSTMTKIVLF